MDKFRQTLNKKIKDEIATYAILIAVCVTMIATIGIYTFVQARQNIETANIGVEEKGQLEEPEASIENLTSTENITSVEELQKLNEKELEEAKKKAEKEDDKKIIDSSPKYYIKVNYKAQVVTIYTKDKNGKYTKPVKAMVCSTGTYTPTSGVYKTPYRYRWLRMVGGVYGQYCTQIVGDILFHSVPYLERGNHASLEYWAYDKLGTRASLGCIRLTCKDAKWIYDNCKLGTQVEFYASSNPGPLGKPTARKISSAPASVRGWDPTDPAKGNPWPEYLKNKDKYENNKDDEEDKPSKPTEPTTPPEKPEKPEEPDTNTTVDPTPTPDPEPDTNTEVNPNPTPEENTEINDIENNIIKP